MRVALSRLILGMHLPRDAFLTIALGSLTATARIRLHLEFHSDGWQACYEIYLDDVEGERGIIFPVTLAWDLFFWRAVHFFIIFIHLHQIGSYTYC